MSIAPSNMLTEKYSRSKKFQLAQNIDIMMNHGLFIIYQFGSKGTLVRNIETLKLTEG